MSDPKKTVTFRVKGNLAVFTDPTSARNTIGTDRRTYPVPTQEALRGITEAIYWSPTIRWHVSRVRVMKPIQTASYGVLKHGTTKDDIFTWIVLCDVEYEVEAWFEWNKDRPDLKKDRIAAKHIAQFYRALAHGGRRDVFLGAKQFGGFVDGCEFGEAPGAYDGTGEISFGLMFHSFVYDNSPETVHLNKALEERFAPVIMENGVITFSDTFPVVRRIVRKGDLDAVMAGSG